MNSNKTSFYLLTSLVQVEQGEGWEPMIQEEKELDLDHSGVLVFHLQPPARPVHKLQETAQSGLNSSLLPSPLKLS